MAGRRDVIWADSTLVVVSCGKAKVWDRRPKAGAVPAREAYTSSLFKLCRRYAQARGGPWVILSAKHGFLDPGDPITDYDVAFGQDGAITVDALRRQWSERFEDVRRVISLAGKVYDMRLADVLSPEVVLETPLMGKGLFERTAWLARSRPSGLSSE